MQFKRHLQKYTLWKQFYQLIFVHNCPIPCKSLTVLDSLDSLDQTLCDSNFFIRTVI